MKSSSPATALDKCGVAWRAALASFYVWSCVVYLVYTSQALAVDYCSVSRPSRSVFSNTSAPTVDDPYYYYAVTEVVPDPSCDESGYTSVNRQFVALAAVHLLSAFMYAGAWRGWFAKNAASTPAWALALILLPEALNVAEAALYIYTSTLYAPLSVPDKGNACYADADCAGYHRLHRLELAAAVISLLASVFWAWSWWYTFQRGPGRGLSVYDPDLYSTLLLLVPSVMYVVYNAQIIADPTTYGDNFLYKKADAVYFVGAVLYLVAALRDCGVFFFLPFVPGCAFDFDATAPADLFTLRTTAAAGGAAKGAAGGGETSTSVVVGRRRGSGAASATSAS